MGKVGGFEVLNEAAQLLRVNDVSKLLNIGKSTVWSWVRLGRLPKPFKLSKRTTVWKLSDLRNFINAQALH